VAYREKIERKRSAHRARHSNRERGGKKMREGVQDVFVSEYIHA
jgi:hypothetical protein